MTTKLNGGDKYLELANLDSARSAITTTRSVNVKPILGKAPTSYIDQNLMELAKSHATSTVKNPIKLTFKNLKYEVVVKYGKKEALKKSETSFTQKIIKDVSGYAMPG